MNDGEELKSICLQILEQQKKLEKRIDTIEERLETNNSNKNSEPEQQPLQRSNTASFGFRRTSTMNLAPDLYSQQSVVGGFSPVAQSGGSTVEGPLSKGTSNGASPKSGGPNSLLPPTSMVSTRTSHALSSQGRDRLFSEASRAAIDEFSKMNNHKSFRLKKRRPAPLSREGPATHGGEMPVSGNVDGMGLPQSSVSPGAPLMPGASVNLEDFGAMQESMYVGDGGGMQVHGTYDGASHHLTQSLSGDSVDNTSRVFKEASPPAHSLNQSPHGPHGTVKKRTTLGTRASHQVPHSSGSAAAHHGETALGSGPSRSATFIAEEELLDSPPKSFDNKATLMAPPSVGATSTRGSSATTRRMAEGVAPAEKMIHNHRNPLQRMLNNESINVESKVVQVLDLIYLITAALTSAAVIYISHPKNAHQRVRTPHALLLVWIAFVQLFTCPWMIVKSFERTRKGKWGVVDELKKIRHLYLRSWFALDLAVTIPIEFLFLGWANSVVYVLLWRHLLRFVRCFSLGASVNPLLSARHWFRFAAFCSSLLLLLHITACIFWTLSAGQHLSYTDSLYWAAATLTSTGYGDIPCPKENERAYAVFSMLLGTVTVSTFTAFATKFITTKDPLIAEQEKKKETMYRMMKYLNVPWDLRKEVIACFGTVLNHHTERHFSHLTEDLPEGLRDRLTIYFNANLLRQIPLFAEVKNEEIMAQIASKMHRTFYAPLEYVFHQGEEGFELYFVVHGIAEVLIELSADEEIVVATLQHGSCFGEGALVAEHGHTRSASVQAKTALEVIALSRDDFLAVLERAELEYEDIEKHFAHRNPAVSDQLKNATAPLLANDSLSGGSKRH